MRWSEKVNLPGDTRIRREFLWFPVSLYDAWANYRETRWLESATIEYIWCTHSGGKWQKLRFVEES